MPAKNTTIHDRVMKRLQDEVDAMECDGMTPSGEYSPTLHAEQQAAQKAMREARRVAGDEITTAMGDIWGAFEEWESSENAGYRENV